jgi:hypothetical protein
LDHGGTAGLVDAASRAVGTIEVVVTSHGCLLNSHGIELAEDIDGVIVIHHHVGHLVLLFVLGCACVVVLVAID